MAASDMPSPHRVSIVVHGGAYRIPDDLVDRSAAGTARAAAAGHSILVAGGSALDAIEAAIRVLEDDSAFDAGTGSVLNAAGRVEMDALLCDGSSLKSGAVIGLDNVRHPISVARKLMETTPHAVIAGEGAKAFAVRVCAEDVVDGSELVTPEALRDYDALRSYGDTVSKSFRNAPAAATVAGHDTVGAVALDSAGNIASGTSTGGITMKMVGRVGDSPLFGCGGYADNSVGGASTTGHGESIIKVLLARRAVDELQAGAAADTQAVYVCSAQRAAAAAIEHMRARVDGFGGVIVLAPDGSVAVAHNTVRMAWAACVGGDAATCVRAGGVHAGDFNRNGVDSFGIAFAHA